MTVESEVQNKPPKRLDIRDVAKHARVSSATVSRTINGVSTVDKKLARRVWNAIRDLNYFPNTHARALVSGRSRLLGLLVSEITNPFFPELVQGFEDVATSHGYEILIGSMSCDPDRRHACIRRMLERDVEGVAVMTFGIEQPGVEELALRRIPMVFVDAAPLQERMSAICVDYRQGIREGVQHLAVLGHRRIGFLSGPRFLRSAELRKAAFLEAAAEIGVSPAKEWLHEADHTLEGGMVAMENLLKAKKMPTAVMCSNDMTAIGALRVLARSGIAVPEDVSLIGFDDIHLAEFVNPPLTTIRMSRISLAKAAVEALCCHIETPNEHPPRSVLEVTTSLAVRQSTSYARSISSSPRPARVRAR